MRETLSILIVGILFAICGWWVGFNEGKKLPCEDVVIKEINNLQKDIIQCKASYLAVMIRIIYLEDWRRSILFRPQEFLEPEKQLQEKK